MTTAGNWRRERTGWAGRCALAEFVAHYQCERNHQGLGNELIELPPERARVGRIRRRSRLGGLLNYYARAA
jgi:hypothetical protein